jgi:hypothetical protein
VELEREGFSLRRGRGGVAAAAGGGGGTVTVNRSGQVAAQGLGRIGGSLAQSWAHIILTNSIFFRRGKREREMIMGKKQ